MKSNWITATIDDVCTVVTDGAHNSPKSVEQGHYMASVKDFTEFGFDFSNCKQIGEEDYEKLRNQGCVPEKNDILVGKDGARYFEDIIIYKQDERPALLSSIAILRADCRKITPEFLYYTLKSPAVRKDVRDNYGSGSAIPRIVLKDFKRMPFSFPSIEEQRKITNLFSAIDAKIQINNAINENLLQQAIALFDNALQQSESISFVELGSLADVKGGKRLPKGVNLITKPNSHPYIRVRDLNNVIFASLSSDYAYVDDETQKSIARYITSAGDVLVSIVGTIGLTAIVDDTLANANLTENCVKLTNLKGITPEYLLLFLRSKEGIEAINKGTVGAVQLKLPIKNIQSIPVPLLLPIEMQALDDILSVIFNRISTNVIEVKMLSELRDTLLPKLISGELSVSKINY